MIPARIPGHTNGKLTHQVVRHWFIPATPAASSNEGSSARIGPEIRKNMVGVNINPITQAIPKGLLTTFNGTLSSPNMPSMALLRRPMRSLISMIQPMALTKPGTITTTAINVMNVLRKGSDVRFSNHANGRAKNAATRTVPNPTINVFGMIFVTMRELAILVQFSNVSPGSVGSPGTNVR